MPSRDELLALLTPSERAELERLALSDRRPWHPLPGPQTMALQSNADITGFGGSAGGGKTDLALGLALTQHLRVGLFRQNGTELTAINDRLAQILGSRDAFNGGDKIWRLRRYDGADLQIELGSFPSVGDERKYQGRPHDLLIFDEASNMRESAVRFLLGWLRTTVPGQRCRALLTFNPPTSSEGRWVVSFFAPWLDRTHPRPAKPGELRWFASIDGKDVEVESGEPFERDGETILPQSRTFVPSRITDNPHLVATGYMRQLQSLPEPLRSQMLFGDFDAGTEDSVFQVIPTAWVRAAQARWRKLDVLPQMTSLGVDVARGGRDETVIARRHGLWFDVPLCYPGSATPDGPTTAGLVVAAQRDRAPVHIDEIGVGGAPLDFLLQAGVQTVGVNVATSATATDKSGRLRFRNLRSLLWWRMREALDPIANNGIMLPPDARLLADLTAPTWKLSGDSIAVASREEILEKIGRSPDLGTAYVLALIDTPRAMDDLQALIGSSRKRRDYDPLDALQ